MNLEEQIAIIKSDVKQIKKILLFLKQSEQWVKAREAKKNLNIDRGKLQSLVRSYPSLKRTIGTGHPEYNLTELKMKIAS